jgi:hypothetical protein
MIDDPGIGYLIMQALVVAREVLMREGKTNNAEDMTRLLEARFPQWTRAFPPKGPHAV